jgi:hypothetical protein
MPTTFFSATVATPGTPQRLTATTAPALPVISGGLAGTASPRGSVICFQASPANTAAKSIFIGAQGLSVSTKSGVGFILTPGAFSPAIELSNGTTDLADYWIDTDSANAATEKVLVTVVG